MDGIVLIDKPGGMSSFGVVKRVRWLLTQHAGRKVKVGHTGTLDPFATGLMILVVGSYCQRAGEFSKLGKTYQATMRLGASSSTGDPEGALQAVSDRVPTAQEVAEAIGHFTGEITQTPPRYSAIKINGVRAYKLARAGQPVEVPARTVTVYRLELISYVYPEVVIECDVSSGTYIRTLVQDIGGQLGTGAFTTQLRRTRVGEYGIDQAIPLDAIAQASDVVLRKV